MTVDANRVIARSVATKQSISPHSRMDGLLRFARNGVETSYPVSIGSDVSLAHSPIEPS